MVLHRPIVSYVHEAVAKMLERCSPTMHGHTHRNSTDAILICYSLDATADGVQVKEYCPPRELHNQLEEAEGLNASEYESCRTKTGKQYRDGLEILCMAQSCEASDNCPFVSDPTAGAIISRPE